MEFSLPQLRWNSGIRRFLGIALFLAFSNALAAQTTRYWVGGNTGLFTAVTSWSSLGLGGLPDGAPVAGDFLIFDGSDISDSPGTQTGLVTVTSLPSIALGNLHLQGNSQVVIQALAASTLTINNTAGTDFLVDNGCQITVSTNVNLTLAAAATAGINGTLGIESGRTYTTSGTSITTVSGSINNAGTVTGTLTGLVFSGGTYNHNQNGGTIPTANWATSTCIINGTAGNTMPGGIAQSFENLSWNWTTQSGTVSINNNLTVNGTFRIQSTNGQILNLCGSAANRTATVFNFLQEDGIFSLSNQNGNSGVLIVSGTFTQNGGTLTKSGNNANNELRFAGATDVSPVLSGSINSSGTNPIIFNCNKTAPAKLFCPAYSFDATVLVRVSTGTLDFGNSDKTITVNGPFALLAAGILDMSGSPGHILQLRGATNTYTAGGTFTPGTSNQEVRYEGDQAQNVMQVTYRNLVIRNWNPASATPWTKSLSGAATVNGNLTVEGSATSRITLAPGGNVLTVNGSAFINGYGTLSLAAANLTINGITTVADNGIITDAGGAVNLFGGLVTINSLAQWNIPQPCTFQGGLVVHSPVFSSAGTTYTFNTNDQTIDGSVPFTLPNVATATLGRLLSNANIYGTTISGSLSGVGNFANGNASNNAILTFTLNNNPLTLTGTPDFSTFPNTVIYNTTNGQTVSGVAPNPNLNFYNLTLSGARGANNIVLSNGGIIGIANSFVPSATFTTGNYTTTNNTVSFNGTANQDIPVLRPASPTPYNNVTISGNSVKTLQAGITIAGVLNLNGGILELGNYNLSVTSNAVNAIQGSFADTNMIATDGAGYLTKNAASLQTIYPVGSGGYYSPVTLNAVAPPAGTLSMRAVPTALNPSYINKFWDIVSSVVRTSATAIFQYAAGESNGASQSVSYSANGGVTWQNPPSTGTVGFGVNSFTITGTNPFAGWWTMGYKTFYSYQTGDWNTPTTWTTDPSGTLQIGSTIPGYNDKVVILTGRTVSLSSDISTDNLDITINDGGILNLSTFRFVNPILALRGQGTLRLASANFPSTVTNTFVNTGGGTTEYNAGVTLPVATTTYNNLTVNTAGTVIQLNDITLNGKLYIQQGTYQLNDNNPALRKLTVNGNFTVATGASFKVGTGVTNNTTDPTAIAGGVAPFLNYYDQQSHRIVLYGDLVNNGTVQFTNLPFPVYNAFPPLVQDATTGFATVYFMGASDNILTCNGTTDFYNLVLNKGVDQTFKLTVTSSDYTYFRLFGANNAAGQNPGANPDLKKALWIRNGTLVLQGMVVIPSLSEGNDAVTNPGSDFYIPLNGALVLDGPDVTVLSTADNYAEVNTSYAVSGGSGLVNGVINGGVSSLVVLGKLQVNDGYLSTRESAGIIYTNLGSAQVQINDGVVDTKQFRTSGAGQVSYTQSGGLLMLRGRFQRIPVLFTSVDDLVTAPVSTVRANNTILDPALGSFNLNAAGNIFSVSGGTIRIYDAAGVNGKAIDVFSSPANINVTGGTIEIMPATGTVLPDADTLFLSSAAKYGNLTISRSSGATIAKATTGYPVTVLKNFTLQSGVFNANNQDLTVGGNLNIENGTIYVDGSNRTILNGTGVQVFTINTATALTLNKLKIDKSAGVQFSFAGSQKIVNISDSLWLIKATLNDNGNTLNASKNVYNSGRFSGTGKLVFLADVNQMLDGDGNGIFQNVELNKPLNGLAQVIVNSNIAIQGTISFTGSATGYKLMNLQTYNLALGANASVSGANANRYFLTSGNLGDGGITRSYSSAYPSFTFPLGTTHATVNYTPATISIVPAPAGFGTITVVPVLGEHPNTTTKNLSLKYYWKVRSAGFSGLAPNSVTHTYTYSQDDVASVEANYVPARYDLNTASWTSGDAASVDKIGNLIGPSWLSSTNSIDGDYTAGNNNPTSPFGTPKVFYSRQTGLWSDVNTWSTVNHTTTSPPVAVPGASDIVIIGGNDSVYLTTTINVANTGVRSCASLQIETGSTLDIGYNPGCVFSVVRSHPNGNGIFRLTTTNTSGTIYVFPAGDFSEFNVNSGTTDFYTTNPGAGTIFILPPGVNSYGNLVLSPLGGSNLILPNNNYTTIYGDLTCNGSITDAWLAMTWNGAYGAIVPKTVYVKKNLVVKGGAFIFIYNNAIAQNLIVDGDVVVYPKAAIDVWTATTANTISIGGNLINNSDGVVYGSTRSQVRLQNGGNICDLTFFGNTNSSITNTSSTPITVLNKLTVNKGNSQAITLTLDIGGTLTTQTNNWLTLVNGTLRYARVNPATNFNISTTSTFTIPATAGLYINYSNASATNVLIGNSNADNNDLYLNGKLTLVNGNLYVGPVAAPNNNNDIEYAGSGASEIVVQGGNLYINGQVRRSGTAGGILAYTQSGGTVVINGNKANATNAKLEVLNTGSKFNMSGGTLTLLRGNGGNTFGDLYLRPATSSVSGGEIILAPPASITANQVYQIESTSPLYNLTVTGKTTVTAYSATAKLLISPITILNTLKISNAQSFFDANNSANLNVTIGGDMDNSGTYNGYNNTTTFNGGAQSILGTSAPTFFNLNSNSVTSLTLTRNVTVNNNLSIGTGSLICNAFLVSVKGDVSNNGTVTDAGTGILLNGTVRQNLSGTGSYGRLELNNFAGARTNNDLILQGDLVMTNGILDVNQNILSLGLSSNILGGGFGVTKMIAADGVVSSKGMRKIFNIIGASVPFTFPVGVPGKYTPVLLTINANSTVGSINVIPVNSRHPAVDDPLNVLKYYWRIESSGISGFDGSVILPYQGADVQGDESQYIAARLLFPGDEWSKATPGPGSDNVDEVLHQLSFNYLAGTNNLNGDYTAGTTAAIPDDVPTYISVNAGDWTDTMVWAPVGASPPCPAGGPNGFNVIIDSTVTTNTNYCFAYTTTILNKLRISESTFGHNLGTVQGSGTLYLENGNLPAGNFTEFLDCDNNATLEYGGTSNYSILASQYSSVANLLFTGSGIRTLPNKDLTICNKLVINGPTLDNGNNMKLIILGTMERYNSGQFLSGSGANATVSFSGNSPQTVGGSLGDFTGANRFYNLEINNTSGLSIGANGQVEVNGTLLLTNGLINTSATNKLTITNNAAACVTPTYGSATSYVNGPLIKTILSGSNFAYPFGKGTEWSHSFTVYPSGGGVLNWTAEYFTPNPTSNSLAASLAAVDPSQYWTVKTTAAKTAKIRIAWDAYSDLSPLMTLNGLPDMRVAEYNTGTSLWNALASTPSGTTTLGDVVTTNTTTVSATNKNFSVGSTTSLTPRASFASSAPVCGTAGILMKFTSSGAIPLNYVINYTINGLAQAPITITSLPYTLPTPSAGLYQLTGFTYNSGGSTGVVDPSIVTAYALPVTSNAGPDTSLCGLSGTILKGNNPNPNSGLWTVVSGAGATIVSPTQFNSVFTGIMGTTYNLKWTISNGPCKSSDNVFISFPLAPQKPGAFTSAPTPVCQGATGKVYRVPNVPPSIYTWTYSGSGVTINGSGNSVNLDFSTLATGGTLSVTATNACGTSAARSVNIAVSLLPVAAGLVSGTSTVCQGQSAVAYSVPAIANATGYSWTLPSGATIATGANTNSITVNYGTSAVSGNISVTGTNSCGSGTASSAFPVTVNPLPTNAGAITGSNSVCQGTSGVSYNVAAISNALSYVWSFTGTGATINGTGNSVTIDFSPGATSGNLTVYGVNACGNGVVSPSLAITLNQPPTPVLSIPDSSICEGSTALFTAGPGAGPAISNYNFRINGSSMQSGPANTYSSVAVSDGDVVTVVAQTAASCYDTSSIIPMIVYPVPVVLLTSSDADNSFCFGTSVTFSATNGYSLYTFRVNGATVQTGGSNVYTSSSLLDGQSVEVLVQNALGCTTLSNSIINTVLNLPVVSLSSSDADNKFCAGTLVTYTATAGYTNYDFRLDGATVQTGASNVYSSNAFTNNQSIDVIASNSSGCTDVSSAIVITVYANPVATASNNGPVCVGQALSVSGLPNGMSNYSWSGPNGFTSALQNPSVSASATAAMAGVYTLTVTNASGCQNTATTTVTVNALPVVSAGSNSPICTGNALNITALPNGMVSYTWNGPNGFSSTLQNPSIVNAQGIDAGVYTIIVDDGNCSASSTVNVVINQTPASGIIYRIPNQ
ncbi:MAG: hypothetical protein U0T82_07150 [Bacteroidales bacterium]